ncbi:MAG: hypothetical protein NTW86_31150 [Candidatus Sumerlaeota bacterium]|nr:hypothetical protein [Candidatus Sumerlaeota bacterium]
MKPAHFLHSAIVPSREIDLARGRVLLSLNGASAVPFSVAVTSCARREGVTQVASSFAAAMARRCQQPALLVRWTPPGFPGHAMTKAVKGELTNSGADGNSETLVAIGENLYGLELKGMFPPAAGHVLERLKPSHGAVIIDCPALGVCSESGIMAARADGAILVVEAGRVRRQVIERWVRILEDSKANLLGIVLNKTKQPIPNWLYNWL